MDLYKREFKSPNLFILRALNPAVLDLSLTSLIQNKPVGTLLGMSTHCIDVNATVSARVYERRTLAFNFSLSHATVLIAFFSFHSDIPSFDNETLSTALSANDTLYTILNDKSDNDCDGLLIRTIESGNIMGTCIQNNETSYKLNIVSRENKIQLKILAKNFIHKWIHIIYETLAIEHIVQNCHLGSIAVRQFCLSVVDSVKLSWPEAESECVKRHGHLASIRSAYTQSMIDSMLLSSVYYSEDNAYWVGATDFAHEGDFRWTDSLSFSYSMPDRKTTDCNRTIALSHEQPRALITSPGFPRAYPDNAKCNTLISALPGYRVVLHFEEFVFEPEPQWPKNVRTEELVEKVVACLKIKFRERKLRHECENKLTAILKEAALNYRLNPLLKSLCLSEVMPDRKTTDCNRTIALSHEQPRALITSPGFPRAYPDNAKCNTLISALPGYRVVLHFEEFVFEPEPHCSYDYLIISEDNVTRRDNTRRLCGDWSDKLKLLRYVSKTAQVRLTFISDYSHHYSGFKARISMEHVLMECADSRLHMFNTSCYLFVSYPQVTWYTASDICRGLEGELASIHSIDEHRFIVSKLRESKEYSTSAFYWMGGTLDRHNKWKWIDNTHMDFTAWLPKSSSYVVLDGQSSSCLSIQWMLSANPLHSSGLYWSPQRCHTVGGYVCKKENLENPVNANTSLTGTEGFITSPAFPSNYANNLDYWVTIRGPEETRIVLAFLRLDLEPQSECLYDYVEMYHAASVTPPTRLCGNHHSENCSERILHIPQTPLAERMLQEPFWLGLITVTVVLLVSICSVHNKSQNPVNANTSLTGTEGFITSPAFPSNYANNLDYWVTIRGPEETRIVLAFLRLDLEPQSECLYDYVEMYHAASVTPPTRLCGNHHISALTQLNFVSENNEATLRFHSDYSVSASGFSIQWRAVDVSGCPIQLLTAREGVIFSPNYPHFLLAHLDCTFTVLAPAGRRVWLEIVDYNLEDVYDQNLLQEASLDISLGAGTPSFRPYANRALLSDGAFLSFGERLELRLRTGASPSGRGFKANYKIVNSVSEERVVHLFNGTGMILRHLNFPAPPPGLSVSYNQRLVAPLGYCIQLVFYQTMPALCMDLLDTGPGCGSNTNGSSTAPAYLEVKDSYAELNGTWWKLCEAQGGYAPPMTIVSYLNSIHVRQLSAPGSPYGMRLNVSVSLRVDYNYKSKLLRGSSETGVESCQPNPCQNGGKCFSNGAKSFCQCVGHYTGMLCALTMCELEPCLFGSCELTPIGYKCHCQEGYRGVTCDVRIRPCDNSPCNGHGQCVEKSDRRYVCRCYAWWKGENCSERILHIPQTPLAERMLQEPFWLGLITVTVVLLVLGMFWCARRHFPDKLEKLLAEENERSRHHYPSSSSRSHLGHSHHHCVHSHACSHPMGSGHIPVPTTGTPSPRKRRNNSTPTKNKTEAEEIFKKLVKKPSSDDSNIQETCFSIGSDVNLKEKKVVTFATIEQTCPPVSTEQTCPVTQQSDVPLSDTAHNEQSSTSSSKSNQSSSKVRTRVSPSTAPVLSSQSSNPPTEQSSTSPSKSNQSSSKVRTRVSPSTAPVLSSQSSNPGSDSLSSSDLAIPTLTESDIVRPLTLAACSADSILAMFRNFSSSLPSHNVGGGGGVNRSSALVSATTSPTCTSPQASDDSCTPYSSSSNLMESPTFGSRKPTISIQVPVMDQKSMNTNPGPTILLEVPSSNKGGLSPIHEVPTPALTPVMQRHSMNSGMSDNSDVSLSSGYHPHHTGRRPHQLIIPTVTIESPSPTSSSSPKFPPPHLLGSPPPHRSNHQLYSQDFESDNLISISQYGNGPPVITVTGTMSEVHLLGSPPPHRSNHQLYSQDFESDNLISISQYGNGPPVITVTGTMSEAESDDTEVCGKGRGGSGGGGGTSSEGTGGGGGMCYLSPYTLYSRGASESGYSSMASPASSRCGSNNPLCPSEAEDGGGTGGAMAPGNHHHHRRPSPLLRTCRVEDPEPGDQELSDDCTMSDNQSNDEGFATDHVDDKSNDPTATSSNGNNTKAVTKDAKGGKDLKTFLSPGSITMEDTGVVGKKSLLQLPTIVIDADVGGFGGGSPVSSRSESPLSDKTSAGGLGRFNPMFYGRLTDSDGLYDCPSPDCCKTARRTACRKKERRKGGAGECRTPGGGSDRGGGGGGCRCGSKPSPKRRVRSHPHITSSSSSESISLQRHRPLKHHTSPQAATPEAAALHRAAQHFQQVAAAAETEASSEDTSEDITSDILRDTSHHGKLKKVNRLRNFGQHIRLLTRSGGVGSDSRGSASVNIPLLGGTKEKKDRHSCEEPLLGRERDRETRRTAIMSRTHTD
ncbi:LOW QUALITY PROTEIN: uncharacterized protein LOC103512334 [Diaphorina citri]|uniref:LOW QUALITY PROTEIN: uncharacterized protein LOC103512334 n=1 Tax=Diaphorina citri TaxID=121845 RepID=A0A3Q0IZH6_DIACI|nr:LOW QUALITY PROTEIN: uncharacterized protein LOC103512334 [Diaphorina citri]